MICSGVRSAGQGKVAVDVGEFVSVTELCAVEDEEVEATVGDAELRVDTLDGAVVVAMGSPTQRSDN